MIPRWYYVPVIYSIQEFTPLGRYLDPANAQARVADLRPPPGVESGIIRVRKHVYHTDTLLNLLIHGKVQFWA
jgi:hypothetical protein